MKGMVIRMNAKKNGKYTEAKPRSAWGISLRTGLLGMMAVSILLVGVACTRNGAEDGTVADSNVGSVTSSNTEKTTDKVTEKDTEKATEARTNAVSEPGSGATTMPGTSIPGTMPGTDPVVSGEGESSPVTTPGTTTPGTMPGTAKNARGGKG